MDTKFYMPLNILYFIGVMFINTVAGSCGPSSERVALQNRSEGVELDTSIRHGVLPNGFTYFIRSLPEPQPKLYMRLYNKAGSSEEDADQFDVAHGVEHLANKATKNFPEGIDNSEVIKELEISKYDMLAYSGRFTEYYFDAPPGNPLAVKTAFLFFKDIAQGLSLTDRDIYSVKGELRQEFLSNGADRIDERAAERKLEAGLFPCRPPEPDFLDNLRGQKNEVFRRFYRDWYRPDLLALSIVGNIENVDQLEKEIKETFSVLKPPMNPRQKMDCDSLFLSRDPQFVVVERTPEHFNFIPDTKVDLQILYRDPITMENLDNLRGIKRLFLLRLLITIANERLKESIKGYNSFTVGIRDAYKQDSEPTMLRIQAELENPTVEKNALQQILYVLRQIQEYGISGVEWNDLKQEQMKNLENVDEENPEYWIDEVKNYYTRGEALPANKSTLIKDWFSSLSLSDFNSFVHNFLSKEPEDIGIVASTGHAALALTENEVRSWIKDAYQEDVKPYEQPTVPMNLMDSKHIEQLKRAKVKSSRTAESGAQEYLLSNGVKLILKQVNPSPGLYQDKILIHGFTLKGANCFPKQDFYSAVNAPDIVENSGVSGLNKFELDMFLSKRGMSRGVISSYIGSEESGIQGSSIISNFETILQLIYLHHSSPQKNKKAFEDWRLNEYKSYRENSGKNWIFLPALREGLGNSAVLGTVLGRRLLESNPEMLEGIEKVDFEDSYEIFRELFGNAKDFTFIISGDFQVESILPLAQKYLGNLPNSASSKFCPSIEKEVFSPATPVSRTLEAPKNYRMETAEYNISFVKPSLSSLDWKEQIKVEALGWVTTQKAWRIRFEMGLAVYDVRINGNFNHDLNRYEISGTFTCTPTEYPIVRKEVHKVISEMKSGNISTDVLEGGIDIMHLFYDLDKRGGKHMDIHQNLYERYRYGQPFVEPGKIEDYIHSLTRKDIIEAANEYYQDEYLYEFVMKDEMVE